MRMPRPVDATLHGVVDYQAATTLITAFPRIVGLSGTRSGRQIRVAGAIHGAYSTMTDYPLGIVRAIPFRAHLALDAIGAVALGVTPFVTGEFRKGARHWAPHVGLMAFELMSLAMTDPTGRGDFHGDVESVHEANLDDPWHKIRDGGPAVRAGAASDGRAERMPAGARSLSG